MYQPIWNNVRRLRAEIPDHVIIVAAAKSRTCDEIAAAMDAGISVIGENYIQEAEPARRSLGCRGNWHFIGHLQLNKAKKAVELFDLIETVDNIRLAQTIDRHAATVGKMMPVMIEVNICREAQKNGALPESVAELAHSIALLPNLQLSGLMAMGPLIRPEDLRPYFAAVRRIYEDLHGMCLPGTNIRYLSMGMSDSYKVAIDEGANIVRLGTAIFGPRL